MPAYNIIAQNTENTVVSEYTPLPKRAEAYQSEAQLEKEFIRLLCEVGYTYLPIHTEADLIANLRKQLEKLNNYQFTDGEWERFFQQSIANANEGIKEKTRRIQDGDTAQAFKRDSGESKNIRLLDKKCIHNNTLQVINQYTTESTEIINNNESHVRDDRDIERIGEELATLQSRNDAGRGQ